MYLVERWREREEERREVRRESNVNLVSVKGTG